MGLTVNMKRAVVGVLAAAPLVVPFTWTPAARADPTGPCTALASDNTSNAYTSCIKKTGGHCTTSPALYFWVHVTCTYPDNGRDECTGQINPLNIAASTSTCQYFPPGA